MSGPEPGVAGAGGAGPEALDASVATCGACPCACRLAPGQLGACRARRNVDGVVRDENYGRITSLALDPIEKKPLASFHPGTTVLSLGSYGCNLRCPFCQNHQIAQVGPGDVPTRSVTPEELVALALRERRRDPRMIGIAYTYNEPLVGWEYVRDCARLAREEGLANVLVSNGYATPRVIHELAPLVNAANIDLKGLSQKAQAACGYDVEAVKATIATLVAAGAHVEVTTLVVPGLNDDPDDIARIARWLASLDPLMTYHVTRFFGRWKMAAAAPTPVEEVHALAAVARRYLEHVVVGNC